MITETASNAMMSSILKVIPRLTPAQLLTHSLPKFHESLIRQSRPEDVSGSTSFSVSWHKYAENGHFSFMTDLLRTRPVKLVAIGEQHHQPSILNLQLQMLDAFSSQHPGETVLVVEYFNLAQMTLLNDFIDHKIEIPQLASVYAKSSENFDVEDHLRPLLLLAREKNVPIIAGFPPREWARDFLTDAERVLSKLKDDFAFDRPEDTNANNLAHEAYIETLFTGNPPQETVSQGEVRRGVRILPAQLLKDAVMAWSIDKQLVQGKNVVVLAGAGHLEYGFGVLDRVREANREERMLIICKSTNESRLWLHEGVAGQGVRGVEKSNRATEAAPRDRPIADAVYLYDAV